MAQINPTVRLYVVTLDGSSQTTELRPPDSFEKRLDSNVCHIAYCSSCGVLVATSYSCFHSENYITMVKWVGPERLSVRWVSRAQNMSILSLCDVATGICTTVRTTLWRNLQARTPCAACMFTCFFPTLQKNVMTSEKWLDRQVSVSIILSVLRHERLRLEKNRNIWFIKCIIVIIIPRMKSHYILWTTWHFSSQCHYSTAIVGPSATSPWSPTK